MMLKSNKIKYFVFLFLIVLNACTDDPADEGVDAREKIKGTWVCKEDGLAKALQTYNVTIVSDVTSSNGVLISNFHNVGSSYNVKASLSGSSLNILTQSFANDYNVKNGAGQISDKNDQIIVNYDVEDGSGVFESVRATYTKQ